MSKRINYSIVLILVSSFFSVSVVYSDLNKNVISNHSVDTEKIQRAKEFLIKGNALADKGLVKKAHEYWEIALELNPQLSEARENLGLPSATNKTEIYGSSPVGEFKSNSDRPYDNLVKNYFDKAVDELRDKDFSQALESIDQAGKLDSGNSQVRDLKEWIQIEYSSVLLEKEFQRAESELADGNEEMASEIVDNILQKHPGFRPAIDLKQKINNSSEEDDSGKIKNDLEEAERDEKSQQFAAAKKHYERTVKSDPENPKALKGLERVNKAMDLLPAKLKELEEAIELADYRKASGYLKEVKELEPKYAKLKGLEKKVFKLKPNFISEDSSAKADEAYNLGLESYRKGDLTNAKKFWNDVLDLNPRHEQARRNLDRLVKEHPELQ